MNNDNYKYCQIFGFDRSRLDARLALLNLGPPDAAHALVLHERVIVPNITAIVRAFYDTVQAFPRFQEILERGYDVRTLKHTQTDYLLSLGVGFDGLAYFEERLKVGLAHARVGVPLSLYQSAYCMLQQILFGYVRKSVTPRDQRDALVDFVLRITSLDMSLAVETYHRTRMHILEDSLVAVSEEERQLRLKTQTDILTGMASREYLFEVLGDALAAVSHEGNPICLVMADLDHFKGVNDQHGHLVGDAVLRDVAGRIRSAVRDFDVVGRYGGEEFAVVLRNTPMPLARQITERIRERVAASPIHVNSMSIPMTISLGLARACPDEHLDSLIDRADQAMYAAKQAGRNCVMAADDASTGC
jgi:two-component system cell cycle response regulator